MAPREQPSQRDSDEEVLRLRGQNRQLVEDVARLEADAVRRDTAIASLVLELHELRQQVGQGKPGVNF